MQVGTLRRAWLKSSSNHLDHEQQPADPDQEVAQQLPFIFGRLRLFLGGDGLRFYRFYVGEGHGFDLLKVLGLFVREVVQRLDR